MRFAGENGENRMRENEEKTALDAKAEEKSPRTGAEIVTETEDEAKSPRTGAENAPSDGETAEPPRTGEENATETEDEAKSPQTELKKARADLRKRLILLGAAVGVVVLILCAVLLPGVLRNRKPPELESIRERVQALILASREVNEIYFGEGLPTYPRIYAPEYTLGKYTHEYEGQEYTRSYQVFTDHNGRRILKYQYCRAIGSDTDGDGIQDRFVYPDFEFGGFLDVKDANAYRYTEMFFEAREGAFYKGKTENEAGEEVDFWLVRLSEYEEPFYYTAKDDLNYDYVTEDAPYQTVEELRDLAAGIYSTEYRNSLYGSIFEGIMVSDRPSGILLARYAEQEQDTFTYLMKSNQTAPMNTKRVYDFSTMRMIKPSNALRVVLLIDSYLEGQEDERLAVKVTLVLEDGVWLLDSPTF